MLPGENEREWEMHDREVKRAKERVFFQEKLPLQPGPTGKDQRTNYISDLPYFPPFRPRPTQSLNETCSQRGEEREDSKSQDLLALLQVN